MWGLGVLVVVKDEPIGSMLAIDDDRLAVTISGTGGAGGVGGAQVVGLELDPLAMMTEATVSKAHIGAGHEDDLVILVGSIDGTLDCRIWSPNSAIPSDIGSRGGSMDIREEELQRVLAKVGWDRRRGDGVLPLGAHVLWPSGEAIIGHQKLNTLAQGLV